MRAQIMHGSGRRRMFGALLVAGALAACGPNASNEAPPIPSGAWFTSWRDNGAGGHYLLQIERGRALVEGRKMAGVIRTRSDCEPNGQNLNHCRYTIELSDDARIDVIDHHEVARYRSLQPGESIILLRFNSGWVVAQASGG